MLLLKGSNILITRSRNKKGQRNCHNKTTLYNTQTKESRNTLAASHQTHKRERTWKERCCGDDQKVLAEDDRHAKILPAAPAPSWKAPTRHPMSPFPTPRQHLGFLPMPHETQSGAVNPAGPQSAATRGLPRVPGRGAGAERRRPERRTPRRSLRLSRGPTCCLRPGSRRRGPGSPAQETRSPRCSRPLPAGERAARP